MCQQNAGGGECQCQTSDEGSQRDKTAPSHKGSGKHSRNLIRSGTFSQWSSRSNGVVFGPPCWVNQVGSRIQNGLMGTISHVQDIKIHDCTLLKCNAVAVINYRKCSSTCNNISCKPFRGRKHQKTAKNITRHLMCINNTSGTLQSFSTPYPHVSLLYCTALYLSLHSILH